MQTGKLPTVMPVMPRAGCVAAIDLGTNSFQLVIAATQGETILPLVSHKESIRLGQSLSNRQLTRSGMQRAWRCLQGFKRILGDYNVKQLKIVGTSALRCAINAQQWLQEAQHIIGAPIEIISGAEEARLVYEALRPCLRLENDWIFDIGGGSTEIILGNADTLRWRRSVELGCVILQHQYPLYWAMSQKGYSAMRRHCKDALSAVLSNYPLNMSANAWITSGVAPVAQKIALENGWGTSLNTTTLTKIQQQLCEKGFRLKGLPSSKRQNFPYGLAILQSLIELLNIQQLNVTSLALKDALVQSMLYTTHASN